MLADIASGEVDLADIMFLIATIVGVLAAILAAPSITTRHDPWSPSFGWLAVAFVAFGLMLL